MTNCILLRYDSLTIRNFCRWKENSVSRGEAMRKRRGHPSSFCVAQSGFLNNVIKWIVSIETVGDEAEGGTWEESATRRGDINFLFSLIYYTHSTPVQPIYYTQLLPLQRRQYLELGKREEVASLSLWLSLSLSMYASVDDMHHCSRLCLSLSLSLFFVS